MSDIPWSTRVDSPDSIDGLDNKSRTLNSRITHTCKVRKRVILRGRGSSNRPSTQSVECPTPAMFKQGRRLSLGASGHNKVLEALQIFQQLDVNNQGTLSFDELGSVIPGDASSVRSQLKALDKDGDGKISRLDFVEGLHIFYGGAEGSDSEEEDGDNLSNDNNSDTTSPTINTESQGNPKPKKPGIIQMDCPDSKKSKHLVQPRLQRKRLSIGRTWAARNVYKDMEQCITKTTPTTNANDSAGALAKILFEVLDVDSTGCLGRKGFKECWMEMDPTSRVKVENLFNEIDTLQTGVITQTEFVEYFSALTQTELRRVWDQLKSNLSVNGQEISLKNCIQSPSTDEPDSAGFDHQLFDEYLDHGSDVETFETFERSPQKLENILQRREREIKALEEELRQAKLIAQKINRRCEIMGRENQKDELEKKKLKEELEKEKNRSHNLETLGKSMNEKVNKIETLLKETEQERHVVTITLSKKSDQLKKTLLKHDKLKNASEQRKKQYDKEKKKSKRVSKLLTLQGEKLKKEERKRKQTEAELRRKQEKLVEMENQLAQDSARNSEQNSHSARNSVQNDGMSLIGAGGNYNRTSSLEFQPAVRQPDPECLGRPQALSISQQVEETGGQNWSSPNPEGNSVSLDQHIIEEEDDDETSMKPLSTPVNCCCCVVYCKKGLFF